MKKVFTILLLFNVSMLFSQEYTAYTRQADSLYVRGYYEKAVDTYKKATEVYENNSIEKDPLYWTVYDRIGQCYSKMSIQDSIYKYFQYSIIHGNPLYDNIISEKLPSKDINNLIKLSDSIYIVNNKEFNTDLGIQLRHMFADDQRIRTELDEIEVKYERNKVKYKLKRDSLFKLAIYIGSINVIKLSSILDRYGYPDKKLVGDDYTALMASFVIIQHADIKFQKKYYKVVKKAALKRDIPMYYFAVLTDQMLISRCKKQLYGTQYDEKNNRYPIKKPDSLNQRLEELGLF